MRSARVREGGYSLLELIVAAFCTTLLASAVVPLLVGGAEAERFRARVLNAELSVDSALRAISTDLRRASVGLEKGSSVVHGGQVEAVAGPTVAGGLRLLRPLGAAIEIDTAIDADSYEIGSAGTLSPGSLVIAVGLPARPAGAPLPAGTVMSVFPTWKGAVVDVAWGPAANDVASWGPPRALLPVTWREYQLRVLNGTHQLRRRDIGGPWQPVVDDLAGLEINYLIDKDGDTLPDVLNRTGAGPGSGERVIFVRLEVIAHPAMARRVAARLWVRMEPQ